MYLYAYGRVVLVFTSSTDQQTALFRELNVIVHYRFLISRFYVLIDIMCSVINAHKRHIGKGRSRLDPTNQSELAQSGFYNDFNYFVHLLIFTVLSNIVLLVYETNILSIQV